MKKIIAFSLWGDIPLYIEGAVKNIELAKIVYPDWVCRFYIPAGISKITNNMKPNNHSSDDKQYKITTVPTNIIQKLKELGAEVIEINEDGCWYSMFWRFYAIENSDIAIFRDCDSRLSFREKNAVDEWVNSNEKVHIMRDHPWHGAPILGGMWGIKKGIMDDMKTKIIKFIEYKKKTSPSVGYWQCDQDFLKLCYPFFLRSAIIHDDWGGRHFDTISRPFPKKRYKNQYVGQPYDENNKTLITLGCEMKKNTNTINEIFELDELV